MGNHQMLANAKRNEDHKTIINRVVEFQEKRNPRPELLIDYIVDEIYEFLDYKKHEAQIAIDQKEIDDVVDLVDTDLRLRLRQRRTQFDLAPNYLDRYLVIEPQYMAHLTQQPTQFVTRLPGLIEQRQQSHPSSGGRL